MSIKNFAELEKMAVRHGRFRLGVVSAEDGHVLAAVKQASDRGLIRPVLIGDASRTAEEWRRAGGEAGDADILPAADAAHAAKTAAELARAGQIDGIMKGKLETAELMRPLVRRETGISRGGIMSLVSVVESPYYPKLFAVTDVGLMMYPDLEKKAGIVKNAVEVFHALGYAQPRVAALAAIEKVNPKMPETVDAGALKDMALRGELGRCVLEGPISYDLAMDPLAAEAKGYEGSIRGDADILLVPDIASGNLLAKALAYTGGASAGGIVVGGSVPVTLTSRSSPVRDKYNAIVLMAALGEGR